MNRQEFLLKYITKDNAGLEIGPSHSPTAPKSKGFNVEVIDHTDKQGLVNKYKNDTRVDTSNIEEVDYIWKGEPYKDLTGKKGHYNWVIASHVIEHTPDIIRFLSNCNDVLSDDGKLILAIPDYRHCFDQYRPITGLSKVLDAYNNEYVLHTPGTVAEYYLNGSKRNGQIAWGQNHIGETELLWDQEEALMQFGKAKKGEEYIDAHAWCFTPSSFRLMVHDLNLLDLLVLKEVEYWAPGGSEFFIILSRQGANNNLNRLDLLEAIQKEVTQGVPSSKIKRIANKLKRSISKRYKKLIKK